ncbi:phosphatidylglycerophosphate synthase [Lipingzhangella halophila]|uniref:Phosphatidylglycerophosphate synthase n=1 Tax=Lipingzhangella halophila TaxID=1783352 RepID=A0A7W7RMG6_9ACTN|nr:CDP-alcohol phosphatidyltransferase family protein [Lipingzhangella halophila]MBB4934656.1 phosphatidylglycerophosphate synthase [Lipingzhangella halophila]
MDRRGAGAAVRDPGFGAGAQLILLGLLWETVGLGPAGWLAGTAHAVVAWALFSTAARRAGVRSPGPANRVTLARSALVGGVAALVADRAGDGAPTAALVALAAAALALDAVDGYVARRTGTDSALGARFDMEVDAFLLLVLSVRVAESLGPWVLLIGAARYAFGAAGWAAPWLRAPLPPSFARKTVAALQGIVLVVASADMLPRPVAAGAVGIALVSLGWSFGRDVRWLWRHGRGEKRAG